MNDRHSCTTSIALGLLLSVLSLTNPVLAQKKKSGLDPVREGDQVEVYFLGKWLPAEVVHYENGQVLLKYEFAGEQTRAFGIDVVRFPNEEGTWMVWSDESGKFRIEARLLRRTEEEVTLLKEDGTEVTVPIEKLNSALQSQLVKMAAKIKKMHDQAPVRVGDNVEIKSWWTWFPGIVTKVLPNGALVAYRDDTKETEGEFKHADMRYPNGEGPWREWTDASQKYKVIARYITHDATNVVLLNESGKQIRLERSKLSKKLQTELDAATIITRRPDEVEFATDAVDFSKLTSVSIFDHMAKYDGTQVPIGPGKAAPQLKEGGMGFQVFDSAKINLATWVGTDEQLIAIGASDSKSPHVQPTTLYWASLVTGKAERGPSFLSDEIILGYSPEQERLITAETRGTWSTPVRFCSYRLAPGEPTAVPEAKWSVPKSSFVSSFSSTHAKFVGSDEVLIGYGGHIGMWNIPQRKLNYAISSRSQDINFSPDGKYFCTHQVFNSVLVETGTGRIVGEVEQAQKATFSEDGHFFISATHWGAYAQELSGAKRRIFLPGAAGASDANFFEVEPGWLSDGRCTWQLDRGILAWSYLSTDMQVIKQTAIGDKLLAIGLGNRLGKPHVLIGVAKIPHEIVKTSIEKVSDDMLYVLKPGISVRIDPMVTDQRMLAGIQRAAKQWNWRFDNSSDIVVTASAALGKSEQHTYETSRFGFRTHGNEDSRQTFNIAPWIQSVSISQNGAPLWGTSSGGVPGFISIREGESLEAKLNESSKESYELFKQFSFPERVIAPKYRSGVGTSTITPTGLVDTPVK